MSKAPESIRSWHVAALTIAMIGLGIALRLNAVSLSFGPFAAAHLSLLGKLLVIVGLLFPIGWGALRAFTHVRSRMLLADRLEDQTAVVIRRHGAEVSQLREQLKWKDLDQVKRGMERSAALWGGHNPRIPSETTLCSYEEDPVYHQLGLDPGLVKILSQPIVQRLNHIRHLSFAYLVFRSATHTRLAHSLGACKNAAVTMARVFQEGSLYTRDGRTRITLAESKKQYYTRLAMIAALLHDLGHGPLSHALDLHIGLRGPTQTIKPDRHYSTDYISRYLRSTISDAGVDPDDVIKLIQEERIEGLSPWMHFIAGLVDSPLDVDRMDYLARDAHMTGLSAGALNMLGLMERAVPFQEVDPDGTVKIELAFDPSAVPYIEEFLYARDIMYIKCYEHPTKVVAERMLGKAFDEFRNNVGGVAGVQVQGLALLTDQEMMQLMLGCCGPETLVSRMVTALMKGITYDLVAEVPIRLTPPVKPGTLKTLPTEIQRWATDAMEGFLEEAYLTIPDQWAGALAARARGVQDSQVLVTVPSWSIVGNWNKEGDIRILQKEGQGYTVKYVKEISSTVKDFVRILMQARLKVRVFVDPALDSAQRDRVLEAVQIFFKAPE